MATAKKKASVKVKDLKAKNNPRGGFNPQPDPPGDVLKLSNSSLKIDTSVNRQASNFLK